MPERKGARDSLAPCKKKLGCVSGMSHSLGETDMRLRHAMLRVTPFAIDPPVTTKEMAEFGLCTTSLHVPIFGMVQMYDFLKDCAARGQDAWIKFSAKTKSHPYGGFRFFNLTGFQHIPELEKQFLPKEAMERYEKSLGGDLGAET
jgi:hypothetical protein